MEITFESYGDHVDLIRSGHKIGSIERAQDGTFTINAPTQIIAVLNHDEAQSVLSIRGRTPNVIHIKVLDK